MKRWQLVVVFQNIYIILKSINMDSYINCFIVWPHEVESRFHSCYRGKVKTLDAKYNLSSL